MIGLLSIMLVILLPPVPGKITPELVEILKNTSPQEKVFVIVHMNTQYPYAEIEKLTPQEKCNVFESVAMSSQRDVVDYLNSLPKEKAEVVRQFWIFNGFHLKATRDVIEELARRDDIWFICYNATVQLDYRKGEEIPKDDPDAPEWNVTKVMAESCWAAGFNGAGIILGHIDTGVLTTHEALVGKWLSPYWHDGVNGQSSPYDDNGHGTHTIGTICGGDGPGPFVNDIGVAYGARYIPTKAFNAGGSGQYAWIDACMQYLANLKQQGVDIRAIGNSWGSSNGSDLHWWDIVLNWKNLGVFPVFSNGNSGPSSGTVGAPASYPTTIGVGATNSGDNIASFSSRGPAPNISPINNPQYWYYSTWNLLKPDVSAPGVSVRSSYNNGGYTALDGTSMASPHVTGGTAILLQKNSSLTVQDLYDLFRNYCDRPSQGGTYPNNNYGWGRINLWRSLQNVPTSNRPNVVLNRTVVVNDNNGNGKLDPGENAGIVCYIRNTGGAQATNTTARLRTSDIYITLIDSTTSYGTIPSGDSANNNSDPFTLSVSPNCPDGRTIDFQLYIVCAESSWTRNFSLIVGTPGLDYVTHDCGNCRFTVTRYGALGFMSSGQSGGVGFRYPATGSNHLFYGSFAVGNSPSYCVDQYYESQSGDDDDWATTSSPDGRCRIYEPWQNNIDEYATARYNDGGHSSPQGLLCEQYSWAWNDATANDFVIMKFVLTNTGNNTLSNLYAAIFMDWDISSSYTSNYGNSETARNLTYMYYSGSYPYVGVEVLDPPRTTPARNLAIIDNQTYVWPYYGLPDNIQIQFMDGTIQNPSGTNANDWSTCNSVGPFTLAPGQSKIVAFAILGGTNLADLQANADTAYNRYWNWTVVEEEKEQQVKAQFSVYPVVTGGRLNLAHNGFAGELKITVYDVSGRKVAEKIWHNGKDDGILNIDISNLAGGIYFLNVNAEKLAKPVIQKIILVK
ncbi:MAG: S8 family peptidase [candidate division WOR-3 bacterium]|nr:S8 family peptidase [candidate division WOR-3 bacterium]